VEVIISPEALADIAEIGDYISLDNPERAITFCEELVSVCALLPRRAPRMAIIPEFKREKLRKIGYGRYLIFF
jgi:plasmid stabilization system protein ParE